ncbi:OmpA family protein [Spirosoma agri]
MLTPVIDSLDQRFTLSVAAGTALDFLAAAPGYVSTRAHLSSLNAPRQITLKLLRLKPSVLTIKVFSMTIRQPLTSAVVVITSRITGKSERFDLPSGRLEQMFAVPDELAIQISAAGYTSVTRHLTIDVPPSGKLYELDTQLDKLMLGLTVRVVDNQTGKSISAVQMTLTGKNGTPTVPLKTDPATGLSTADVPGRGTYQLMATAAGYENFSRSLLLEKEQNDMLVTLIAKPAVVDTKSAAVSETIARSVATKPFGVIEKGKTIRLNKIYFDQSSPVLRPASYAELDQLVGVLVQSPSLRIEIRGYTDNQGDFDLNTKLSRDRCQAVIEYLIAKGVHKSRLKAIGRGPLDPVAPNNNEDNRRKNRRVEFVAF